MHVQVSVGIETDEHPDEAAPRDRDVDERPVPIRRGGLRRWPGRRRWRVAFNGYALISGVELFVIVWIVVHSWPGR
ncbi:hypothetical protein [Amycolatopsis rubida]|uniref:hypothetical protein n=1 Tax=Amycolatopsis rubida TaxID=112413 RepID=UPI000B84E3A3|nr:hypothetical protein [Amycolatopsis rubida]